MDIKASQVLAGRNLQKFRTKEKLTQEQVAEEVGISTSFYANLERGNRSMSVAVLLALADFYHVTADSILYEDNVESHIKNICHLLADKSESFIKAAENVVNALVTGFSSREKC